jgi:hypothetical protein
MPRDSACRSCRVALSLPEPWQEASGQEQHEHHSGAPEEDIADVMSEVKQRNDETEHPQGYDNDPPTAMVIS